MGESSNEWISLGIELCYDQVLWLVVLFNLLKRDDCFIKILLHSIKNLCYSLLASWALWNTGVSLSQGSHTFSSAKFKAFSSIFYWISKKIFHVNRELLKTFMKFFCDGGNKMFKFKEFSQFSKYFLQFAGISRSLNIIIKFLGISQFPGGVGTLL